MTSRTPGCPLNSKFSGVVLQGFRNTVCCVLPGNVLFEEVVGGLRTVTTSVPFSLKNAASTQLGRISHCCLAVHLRFFLLSERICKNLG
ncbi:uncharacterized protein LOC119167716 isoform X2 [Rhipicephalus microplus]|uniref:uncharacterized protein LOC119167716 isoform X2 n=1 Tax=Rhipicephalus microplus TaxID=6941 RepID=UPI003F6AD942